MEYAIGKCESIVPYHPCAHKIKEQVCIFCVFHDISDTVLLLIIGNSMVQFLCVD